MVTSARSSIRFEKTEEEYEEEVEELQYEIASYPADFTLRVLYDKWTEGQLIIPDFQRNYVWTRTQASRLVESFLLGLPVPGVFLYKERRSQKLLVVDGHQRLGTIGYFYKGIFKDDKAFRLQGVGPRWAGKTYEELLEPDRLRLDDSVLRATVIQQLHPGDHSSVYLIFERLNTGGTQLNPMEIRKCLYTGPAYQLLETLNATSDWRGLLGKPRIDPRLKDVELVLRVLAMARGWTGYEKPMKKFLSDYMDTLHGEAGERLRTDDEQFFLRACKIARQGLGEAPFHVRKRLNLAALDSGLATIARIEDGQVSGLKQRYARLLKDPHYSKAITYNTSDAESVRTRFTKAASILLRES
jgi:hypothetical protein